MMGPVIKYARKEYVSYFNLRSKLIQYKASLNKIIALDSDSEKNAYQQFQDLMPNIIHLLYDKHLKRNVREKALKSEVSTLINDTSGRQIEGKVETSLADVLTTEEFTATIIVLE